MLFSKILVKAICNAATAHDVYDPSNNCVIHININPQDTNKCLVFALKHRY